MISGADIPGAGILSVGGQAAKLRLLAQMPGAGGSGVV